ncbi:MAG: class I SAM-dependent methyltransferase [Planctomycetota bacterium]
MPDPSSNQDPTDHPRVNEWTKPEHVESYLATLTQIPHRREGEATLLSEIPKTARRILDLGCGNGHLLAIVLAHCEQATGLGLDLSPVMLDHARQRFSDTPGVEVAQHNLDEPLPPLDRFDVVVSSFAIHHCDDRRKRAIYAEVYDLLLPGGVFCNLEHVASPTEAIHLRFLQELNLDPSEEDPSNQLLDTETQLSWLRDIGFQDVDCHWKWRELALLTGHRS